MLTTTGWSREYDHRGVESALSPDRTTRMGTRPDFGDESEAPAWSAETELPTGGGGTEPLWAAWFGNRTPAHLVCAFAEALVNVAPVYRGSSDVPHPWLVTQNRTHTQGDNLDHAHKLRLDQARAATRKLRKATATAAAPSPGPATKSPRTGRR